MLFVDVGLLARFALKHALISILALGLMAPLVIRAQTVAPDSGPDDKPYVIPHKLSPCQWRPYECIGPGIYMDEPILLRVNEVLFKVPAIYFTSWHKPEDLGHIIEDVRGATSGIDFAFWMPTKRPEEIKTQPPMLLEALLKQGAKPAHG
jgi:hypothetical protein